MKRTPGVRVICEDSFECPPLPESEWYTIDVITCAAPDQRPAGSGTFCPSEDELYEVMCRRISRIYSIAAQHHANVLIMGAFGCGVFRNSPDIVAHAFGTVTKKFGNTFECVEYAVAGRSGDSANYLAFQNIPGIVERN